jgi:hypothetical protein
MPAEGLPPIVSRWAAYDTYVKRSGTRKVSVFEPGGC